jgi:hypothetical protein
MEAIDPATQIQLWRRAIVIFSLIWMLQSK